MIFYSWVIFIVPVILCNPAIGLPTTTESSATGVVALALGDSHSMLLKQDGSVWTTGMNKYGQLGDGSKTDRTAYVQVVSGGAMAMAAGNYHSIALEQDGSVWTTGQNRHGQLGDGSIIGRSIFVQVISGGAKAVAAGGHHSIVLKQDSGVWATGWNRYGQLGHASEADEVKFTSTFVRVMMPTGAKAVVAGDAHSVVLKQDGSVWATGSNDNGQLGDGSRTDRSTFVQVISNGVEAVAAGGYHSMVLRHDGSIWVTGSNNYGQLGDAWTRHKPATAYAQVFFVTGVIAIDAGSQHSMVLQKDGSVLITGRNHQGQLGDGYNTDRANFVEVFVRGAKTIAAGGDHSMVLKQDGSVWATGSNKHGQLGRGSTISENKFVRVVKIAKSAFYGDTVVWHFDPIYTTVYL